MLVNGNLVFQLPASFAIASYLPFSIFEGLLLPWDFIRKKKKISDEKAKGKARST